MENLENKLPNISEIKDIKDIKEIYKSEPIKKIKEKLDKINIFFNYFIFEILCSIHYKRIFNLEETGDLYLITKFESWCDW